MIIKKSSKFVIAKKLRQRTMTLQQMEYIVAVYRLRHFAKAAEACNVTQPTLSAMIQKLEDELGIKLFDRTKKPICPTPCGKLVIEQAWRVLIRAKKIKDVVAQEKNSLAGGLRIGILPTIAPYLLPRFLPKLLVEHKEIDVTVSELKTDEIKRQLARGEIDMAIIARLDNMEHFVQTSLFFEQCLAYVSRNDALFDNKSIKTTDLKDEFLWMLDEGHCFSDQLSKFCDLEEAKTSKTFYRLGSIETFMRIVENGQGMTFIPELALPQLSESQRELVRPFAIPIPTREIILLTSKTYVRTSVLNLITQTIRGCVPENMLKMNNTEQRV